MKGDTHYTSYTFEIEHSSFIQSSLLQLSNSDGIYFKNDEVTIAGFGCAFTLTLDQGDISYSDKVVQALNFVDIVDEVEQPGSGPIFIGAIRFDRSKSSFLRVPRTTIVLRSDGKAWVTHVAEKTKQLPTRDSIIEEINQCIIATSKPTDEPNSFILTSQPEKKTWIEQVNHGLHHIRLTSIEKLVLSRQVLVEADKNLNTAVILERLSNLYPTCTIFHISGFVGASPELLISKKENHLRSLPLAGTVARSGNDDVDALLVQSMLQSNKERNEHAITASWVGETLTKFCSTLSIPKSPSVISLRNVSHLATDIRGVIDSATRDPGILDIVRVLHPTPAIAGYPVSRSIEILSAIELYPRDFYSGPIGWCDRNGNGNFVVGIRSAYIHENSARLYAGVGIVSNSDPIRELAETQLKLQAVLSAIVRP